jgi:LacI family transcriptional regulator
MTNLITRKRTPTISDVAAAAGVSSASVSRAFTRADLLSAATVEHILRIANEIGYVPNHVARALSTGRHGNIGIIVSDLANPFFTLLIRAVQIEADRHDFCVFLGNTDESPRQEDKLLNRFSGQVEGIILVAPRLTNEKIHAHAEKRALVLVNRDMPNVPRVLIDSSLGVTEAVAHLAELGHRSIIYVRGPPGSWANQQRRSAVQAAAKTRGMEFATVCAPVPTFEAGRSVVPQILASPATAVVAFDDLTAQGILAGLAEAGISVPRQMSVVGCDDVLGASTYPPLTTVSSRPDEAGRTALSLLLDVLRRRDVKDVRYSLDTHLVIRSTTSRPAERDRCPNPDPALTAHAVS